MEPVEYPIDGELDLHQFRPQEVKDLVPEYLELCRKKGIYKVRVVHGKGRGTLRETVHHLLARMACVERFRLADERSGSWGATWVWLKPATKHLSRERR
ncbi:MAG: DNA mismatch repair protein MutS [Opitutae bacterium]|nr:DNA mismatch repair protein MutS [Opitutae bacterium]